jgi:hypothetical protein
VAELIAQGKVTTVGMIENKMGYRAANPFTIYNRSFSGMRVVYLALLMYYALYTCLLGR